jgi:phosphatidylserine synthase
MKKNNVFFLRISPSDLFALTGVLFSLVSILHSHFSRFENAVAFMFVAMLINLLDPYFVRIFKSERYFGGRMNSLIEFLAYIISPAVFFYYYGFERLHIVWILLLFGACGIARLSADDQAGAEPGGGAERPGMPLFWASFISAVFYGLAYVIKGDAVVYLAALVILTASFLLVLNRPFVQLKADPFMFVLVIGLISFFLWLGINKGFVIFQI